jgi:hypothetical protein
MSRLVRHLVVQEGAKLDGFPPSCRACAYSYFEPGPPEEELICHEQGPLTYEHLLEQEPSQQCPDYIKFKQHPLRTPDGLIIDTKIGGAWPYYTGTERKR